MSYEAIQWVKRHSQATKTALTLIGFLADEMGKDGVTWRAYSMEELGELGRTSDRQAQRNVHWLVTNGELRMKAGNGRGHRSVYILAALADGWRPVKGDSSDTQRVTVATEKGDSSDAYKEYQTTYQTTDLKPDHKSSTTDVPRTEEPPENDDVDDWATLSQRFPITRAPGTLPRTYTVLQLRAVALAMGDPFGFREDWPNFDRWLKGLDPYTLGSVIVLLFHYASVSDEKFASIRNLPGLIRNHVDINDLITLPRGQSIRLGAFIDKILILNERDAIDQPIDDDAYKRKTKAWVEPKHHEPTITELLLANR